MENIIRNTEIKCLKKNKNTYTQGPACLLTYPRQYSSPVKQKGTPGKKNDLTSEAIQLFLPV